MPSCRRQRTRRFQPETTARERQHRPQPLLARRLLLHSREFPYFLHTPKLSPANQNTRSVAPRGGRSEPAPSATVRWWTHFKKLTLSSYPRKYLKIASSQQSIESRPALARSGIDTAQAIIIANGKRLFESRPCF